jgi:hypothetical protein
MNILIQQLPLSTGLRREVVIAVIAAALFSLESWVLGPLSWIYGYGSGLETIPALKALSFEGRNLSLWSPFVAGGIDRLAFWSNANPFGPEYLLFSSLPAWLANGLHRFLQYFVAVFFTIRISNEQLGLKNNWGILSGLLFGCFSYFTVGALFTLPGVPLMLWLLSRSVGITGSYARAAGSALLLSFATTFTFGVPYLLTFAVLWMTLVQKVNWRIVIRHFIVFSITLIIATAPQLLAIAVNAATSHRASWDLEPITASIDGLFYRQLQFDLFGQNRTMMWVTMNIPALVFFAGLAMAWRARRQGGPTWSVAATFLPVAAIFFLLSQKWAWLLLQSAVTQLAPFASGIYMGRFFQIPAPFVIAVGVTLTLRLAWVMFINRPKIHRALIAATVCLTGFMLLMPKIHLFYDLGVNDWGEANYKVSSIDALHKKPDLFRVASVLPLQPAYAYAQGLETADGWANVYPAVYRDLWLRVLSPLFKELPSSRKIFGADSGRAEDNFIFLGADLVHPSVGLLPGEDVNEALRNGFDVDRRFNLNLLRMLNVRYLLSQYPLQGSGLKLVHAADPWPTWAEYRDRNTGLVVGERHPPEMTLQHSLRWLQPFWDYFHFNRRKLQGKDVFVYELTDSMDRFRLIHNLEIEANGKAVLDRLSSMDAATLRSTAVLETLDAAGIKNLSGLSGGTIKVIVYNSDRIELEVFTSGNAFLVMASTWSPYWTAEIDRRKVPLIRTNHAQYGLQLDAGMHTIKLAYRPPYALGL